MHQLMEKVAFTGAIQPRGADSGLPCPLRSDHVRQVLLAGAEHSSREHRISGQRGLHRPPEQENCPSTPQILPLLLLLQNHAHRLLPHRGLQQPSR